MTTSLLDNRLAATAPADHPSQSTVRLARRCLATAGVLGILGDALLRRGIWGLGFPLFVMAMLGALAWLVRSRRNSWTLGTCLLVAPTIFFATSFAWRASGTLLFYNTLALLAALAALATAVLRGEAWEPSASVGDYVRGAVRVATNVAGGSGYLLLGGGRVHELPSRGRVGYVGAIVRGLVIALPILFVFGSLLSSADPVFERLLTAVFDVEALVSHTMVILCVAWVVGGYLRAALFAPGRTPYASAPAKLSLGLVEVALVLALLDLLFLGFVVVQLRYLFGGAEHVAVTPGLTYAEYARRGFFELVWVAVLALPTLLAADGLLRREQPRSDAVFRALAGALVLLLGVVMLSAMQRMRLYQREYGLTETRLYASAAMGWLACVFAWFAATVLRGRRAPFAFGALVSAWGFVAALDFANPDALIADTNFARLARGQRFDAWYITSLSADATPRVMRAYESLPADERCAFARGLLDSARPDEDWRVWNLGRARARHAVRGNEGELREVAAACDARARERARAASAAHRADASAGDAAASDVVAPAH